MTEDEARKVTRAFAGAHGACYVCVSEIADELDRAFPEHDWYALVNDAVRVGSNDEGWIHRTEPA